MDPMLVASRHGTHNFAHDHNNNFINGLTIPSQWTEKGHAMGDGGKMRKNGCPAVVAFTIRE